MSAANPGLILAAEEAEKRAEAYRREAVEGHARAAAEPVTSANHVYLASRCMVAAVTLDALALHLREMAEGQS